MTHTASMIRFRHIVSRRCHQQGVMLLEALIGILIFSIGILAIIGLQSTAVVYTTDAKYRTDAGLLANQLVARMWSLTQSVKGTPGMRDLNDLQNKFQGGIANTANGAQYDIWAGEVAAVLPGVVINTATNIPSVSVDAVTGEVTIRIYWTPPNQQNAQNPIVGQRQYVTVARIS